MSATKKTEAADGRRPSWKQNPEAVKADILAVARAEFSEHGLSGARIQDIADRTKTSKRMIFYYFGDKESLYRAVLEQAYAEVRQGEAKLDLEGLQPGAALERLVRFTFDHHRNSPAFIRLVMIENIHRAEHLKASASIRNTNSPVIAQLTKICRRGVDEGLFRPETDPLKVHWLISALSFFNVSNQSTFTEIFGADIASDAGQDALREFVVAAVMRSVLAAAQR